MAIPASSLFPLNDAPLTRRKRLYCLHHAGGSVLVFRPWMSRFSGVDVVPVELPGHFCELGERRSVDFDALARQLALGIAQKGAAGASILGHSLGAALAFQVTWLLENEFHQPVERLIVAGRHAPCDAGPLGYRTYQGMEALKGEMARIGATPPDALRDADFCRLFLPVIFDDYRLHESYRYRGERVGCPIVALAGTQDVDASPQAMSRWSLVGTGGFKELSFAGGHFFLYEDSAPAVESALANLLAASQDSVAA